MAFKAVEKRSHDIKSLRGKIKQDRINWDEGWEYMVEEGILEVKNDTKCILRKSNGNLCYENSIYKVRIGERK